MAKIISFISEKGGVGKTTAVYHCAGGLQRFHEKYASDYCVSPIKLDNQSAIGVPSTVEAIRNVDEDIQALAPLMKEDTEYADTVFLGALGMMCREWGGTLKYSEQTVYNRLRRTAGVFESYVTEGDGLRQAAAQNCLVYDITSPNGIKQSDQFQDFITELLTKI
ncbi:MAG: ParA family protein [Gammaproteobacteria bacterium]|nr:ParA family protein [Gammaproteobacteria bacterium]